MRKLIVLIVLSCLISLPSYSQKLTKSLLKEINLRIAEGIECKRLLEEKSNQVVILQNLSKEQTGKAENLEKQITLLTENNAISEGREAAALALVAKCNDAKAQAERDVIRLRKARNRYAWIAGIETVAIAAVIYLSIK